MKLISLILLISFLAGCTTFKPIEMSSFQPERHLDLEKVIKPGDRVCIVTKDGEKNEFRVTAVTNDSIEGKNVEIPLMNIASTEKAETKVAEPVLIIVSGILLVVLGVAASDPAPTFN